MRDYRIVRTDLWWNISRKKQMWRLMLLQYLNWKGLRTPNKWLARIFYHREDAVSALMVMKKKDEQKSD
jgi:hypothetical protein